MTKVQALRLDCAEKRTEYRHSKQVYDAACELGLATVCDMSALRGELEQSLLAYYAAHSALHTAIRRVAPTRPLLH